MCLVVCLIWLYAQIWIIQLILVVFWDVPEIRRCVVALQFVAVHIVMVGVGLIVVFIGDMYREYRAERTKLIHRIGNEEQLRYDIGVATTCNRRKCRLISKGLSVD